MRTERSPDHPVQRGQIVDRIIQLRGALEGITADNAGLRRELARLRRENRLLHQRLADDHGSAQSPDPDLTKTARK